MALKKILASLTRADLDFNLIEDGDLIAVGVSGGKDSMLLLKALKQYQMFPRKNFDFIAVFLDLGFGNVDQETLRNYCKSIDVKLHIEDSTEVYKILSAHKTNTGNLPCSICSRMKKAAINKVAHQLNCNKVAFAHHCDDAIETLLMNTIYGGRIATFAPKMYLSDTKLTFIRPFILVREKEIISSCKSENVPIIKSACPNDHVTMREDAKNMLKQVYDKYPTAYNNYQNMLSDNIHFDLWLDKKDFPIRKDYTIHECITQKDFFEVVRIRNKVFTLEQGITLEEELEDIDLSEKAHFYLLCYKGEGVGTISYIEEENRTYHLRRFAILKEHRGGGLGREFFTYVECAISGRFNPCTIYFTAESYLKEFYESMGYEAVSEEFIKYGTKVIEMKKQVTNVTRYKIK